MSANLEQKLKATREALQETRRKLHLFAGNPPLLPRDASRGNGHDMAADETMRASQIEIQSLNEELQSIFEEYHQINNIARERSRGLGLGLSIVHRLGVLLDHRVRVRSTVGKGSVFAIDIKMRDGQIASRPVSVPVMSSPRMPLEHCQTGRILVVEDDPEVRELVDLLLKDEGHTTEALSDGLGALDFLSAGEFLPDLILADYNLPNGLNGLQLTARIRDMLHRQIPVVIMTGDVTSRSLGEIADQNGIRLTKPVKMNELTEAIQRLMAQATEESQPLPAPVAHGTQPIVYLIDDDPRIRLSLAEVLEDAGHIVECFESAEAFLAGPHPAIEGCLLVDAGLPGMSGIELLKKLKSVGNGLPAVLITGNSDVHMAVEAMKAGAMDFVEKPIGHDELIQIVTRCIETSRDHGKLAEWRDQAAVSMAGLTPRQRQVLDMVLGGHPSKNIAADLGISQRTVENHRAAVMKKTGARSIPALVRLTLVGSP